MGLRQHDNEPVVIHPGASITRGELRQRSDDLLEILTNNNIERALVRSDDPVHILRAIDACNRAGTDLFIAHTNLPAQHLTDILETFAIQIQLSDDDTLCTAQQPGAPGDARIFMMTSGTTGRPKIATHTLESILSRIKAGAKFTSQGGKWLLTYQPTGFAGLQVILTALLAGGAVVVPEKQSPAAFFEAARKAQVTQISGTPTFWRSFLMVHEPGSLDLRQLTLGGEAADQSTLDRLKTAFPAARITHIYASTEAGVVFAVHDGIQGFPSAWLDQPNQGVQLRLKDGLLQIKNANAMRGYITSSTQPLLEDGWLSTADRCEIRGDRVNVLGRDDSTINVAGSKVYPLAVEIFLLTLPCVAEARVYGVPNPISGSLVAADVVLREGEDPASARPMILSACRSHLAGYQVPRVFKIVESIAVGASGKKVSHDSI